VVGDLQQPLHSGYAHDRGGNAVAVTWFGEASNLHSVWDTGLVEQRGLSYTEYAAQLSARMRRMAPAEVQAVARAGSRTWIQESRDRIDAIYVQHARNSELGYDYAFEFVPLVEAQLMAGALRLAHLLNDLLD
jgi:hypothetical protein